MENNYKNSAQNWCHMKQERQIFTKGKTNSTNGRHKNHLLRSQMIQVESRLALTRMLNDWQMQRHETLPRWPNSWMWWSKTWRCDGCRFPHKRQQQQPLAKAIKLLAHDRKIQVKVQEILISTKVRHEPLRN